MKKIKSVANTPVKRNIVANLFGVGVQLFNQVILVPFYLHFWDTNLYSDWIVITSISSFFSMSDIGLNSVTNNDFVMNYASKKERCKSLLANNYALIIIIASVALLGSFLYVNCFDITKSLNLHEINRGEGSYIFIVLIIETYKLIYDSLQNVKQLWIDRYNALSNINSDTLNELKEVNQKLGENIREVMNPGSKFQMDIKSLIQNNRQEVSSEISKKQIELIDNGKQKINNGENIDSISSYLTDEINTLYMDIFNKISSTKQRVATKLKSSITPESYTLENNISIQDNSKKNINRYYGPILYFTGAKGLILTCVGGPVGVVAGIIVGSWAAWKSYKDSGNAAHTASLQENVNRAFAEINRDISAQLTNIDLMIPAMVNEYVENLKTRITETTSVLEIGLRDLDEKKKEVVRISKHEIEPITQIQAECLRHSKSICFES